LYRGIGSDIVDHDLWGTMTQVKAYAAPSEAALQMGAVAFHKMDQDAFAYLTESYDLILNTVSATVDTAAYFNLLKFDGVFVVIGADPSPFVSISTSVGVTKQRVFTLSLISGVQETQDMLNFCGEHNLLPEIESIPASYINEAYDRGVASDVRYRFVIDNSTM
jgi:alcohol dehydrogenase (NADP+)